MSYNNDDKNIDITKCKENSPIQYFVTPTRFPKQGKYLNQKVQVWLHENISTCNSDKCDDIHCPCEANCLVTGTVMREDIEAPLTFIVKLDDGRFITADEIFVYRIYDGIHNTVFKEPRSQK